MSDPLDAEMDGVTAVLRIHARDLLGLHSEVESLQRQFKNQRVCVVAIIKLINKLVERR